MAVAGPLFDDLLHRLATEHKREICELRAEIARLSQFHHSNDTKHNSAGVKHVSVKCCEDSRDVVVYGSSPLPPKPLPEVMAGEAFEDGNPDFKPDEEALAAAFAVATDLSTDKELMKSVHVWPDKVETDGAPELGNADEEEEEEEEEHEHQHVRAGPSKSGYNVETRSEALGSWELLLKHARHEIYLSELPAVHSKWHVQDNATFNLKNLIGGAKDQKPNQTALKKADTLPDGTVIVQSTERLMVMLVVLCRFCVPKIPLNPSSRIRLTWDLVGFLLLCHDLIMAPMAISFDNHPIISGMPETYEEFTKTFDVVSAVYWTADIFMSFVTAYHTNSGIMETRMGAIAAHYLKTWFPVDFSIVCIDLGVIIIMGRSQGGLRAIKTISRAMRITRLLRFAKMSKHVAELMARINSEYILQVVGLLRLLVVIIILNHYIACAWFLVATLVEHKQTWADHHLLDMGHADLAYAYFSSLHWSLTQFTPASMEIFPRNAYERMFNCLVIMFAFVFFSSFVSSITNAMTHIRNINAQAVARDTMVRRYFSENNISHGLAARVWHFIRHKRVASAKKLKTDEVPILQQLPVRIKDELKCEVYAPIMSRHPLLSFYLSSDPAAMRKICKKGIEERTLPMAKELRFEDEVKKMLFIHSGSLEFHMSDTVESDEEATGFLLEPGDWCCEAALWADKVQLDGHFLATGGGCDIVLLDAEVFRSVAVENFETIDVLTKYSVEFIERFRASMQDSTAVKENLMFNKVEPIKDMVTEITQTILNRRSILTTRLSTSSKTSLPLFRVGGGSRGSHH